MIDSANTKDRKTILVVEDDPHDFAYLQHCFASYAAEQIELTWAKTIDDADDLLRSTEYDLVVLDYFIGNRTPAKLLNYFIDSKLRSKVVVISSAYPTTYRPLTQTVQGLVTLDKTSLTSSKIKQTLAALGVSVN